MSNVWCVRPIELDENKKTISKSNYDDFFDNKFVSLGIPFTGDLSNVKKSNITKQLKDNMMNLSDSTIGQYGKSLERFIYDIEIEDYIILLQPFNMISIAKITSDYYYEPKLDRASGFPHQRKVEWRKVNVTRSILSMPLRRSFGSPSPVSKSNYYEEIQNILDNVPKKHEEIKMLNIQYQLRSNLSVSFEIPSDITKLESERLSDFIKTIYYK